MDKRIFFLIVKAEQAVTSYFRQELLKAGLKITPGQSGLLFLLEKKSPGNMSELSGQLEMDNSAVTRIVDRLEKGGFVKRELNKNDRREFLVTITDSGLEEIKGAKSVVKNLNKKLEKNFSSSELDQFRHILTEMANIFKTD
jgi:DNA-binding MarR family transcriptional regulator